MRVLTPKNPVDSALIYTFCKCNRKFKVPILGPQIGEVFNRYYPFFRQGYSIIRERYFLNFNTMSYIVCANFCLELFISAWFVYLKVKKSYGILSCVVIFRFRPFPHGNIGIKIMLPTEFGWNRLSRSGYMYFMYRWAAPHQFSANFDTGLIMDLWPSCIISDHQLLSYRTLNTF